MQDILEHRFAHIRAGMGTHKAPTSVQAIEAGRHGDTIRLSDGGRRRNASRSAGKPFEIQGRVQSMRLALPVNAPEREAVVRAATRDDADHVFETRSARCAGGCALCWV